MCWTDHQCLAQNDVKDDVPYSTECPVSIERHLLDVTKTTSKWAFRRIASQFVLTKPTPLLSKLVLTELMQRYPALVSVAGLIFKLPNYAMELLLDLSGRRGSVIGLRVLLPVHLLLPLFLFTALCWPAFSGLDIFLHLLSQESVNLALQFCVF